MTDCEQDRLPLVSRTKTRSPGRTNVCILRQTVTWSAPEFDRESEARTRPSFVLMPRQYVIATRSPARIRRTDPAGWAQRPGPGRTAPDPCSSEYPMIPDPLFGGRGD